MFRPKLALAAFCVFPLFSQYASADFDFAPKVTNGKIFTGGHDDENAVDVPSLRVGNYAFGDPSPGSTDEDPYNFEDPGFNTDGASAFTANTQLRLVPRAIGGIFLRYWNGTGTPAFTATPGAESISLIGSATRGIRFTSGAATQTPVSATSLLIGAFADNGALHDHLGSNIAEGGVSYDGNGDPVAIPAGAYLVSFVLTNPGTGLLDSDPLFVVYNNGLSDAANDAAVAYVNSTYVPEPAALCVVGLVGTGLLSRWPRARPGRFHRTPPRTRPHRGT